MAQKKGTAYEFDLPAVLEVTITPNPVSVGGRFVIAVTAAIQKTTLYAEEFTSGEVYESEV